MGVAIFRIRTARTAMFLLSIPGSGTHLTLIMLDIRKKLCWLPTSLDSHARRTVSSRRNLHIHHNLHNHHSHHNRHHDHSQLGSQIDDQQNLHNLTHDGSTGRVYLPAWLTGWCFW